MERSRANHEMARDGSGKGLPARVAAIILFAALGALLTATVLEIQAGATAYIVGESHWSKAQQTAVSSLYRYASHGDPADLARARRALRVPLGDRAGRQALDRRPIDIAACAGGSSKAAMHPPTSIA